MIMHTSRAVSSEVMSDYCSWSYRVRGDGREWRRAALVFVIKRATALFHKDHNCLSNHKAWESPAGVVASPSRVCPVPACPDHLNLTLMNAQLQSQEDLSPIFRDSNNSPLQIFVEANIRNRPKLVRTLKVSSTVYGSSY